MPDETDVHSRGEPVGGTIIADRYKVERLIARGGMAAVYLAKHITLNRPIALKILSPPPEADDAGAFEERFRLEAETLASLDHRNIVILHDFGETTDSRFFLAMEYVNGSRLSDLLRDGPVPVDRTLKLIIQVCQALRYAHKRGVVHRDLKPSNLLIRKKEEGDEQIKVVDFGLVKLTEVDQSITRAGLILGSPHCMSPEQVKGVAVDHRADIYSTGVLLFRCLTGQYPFHGPNSAATMIAHLNQPVPAFFSVAPELVVPDGLEECVRRCLEKDPDARYQSMQELVDVLSSCMNVPPDQFRTVTRSQTTFAQRGPSASTGITVLGLIAVSLLALSILAWVIFSANSTAPIGPPSEATVSEEPVPEPSEMPDDGSAPEIDGTATAGDASGTDGTDGTEQTPSAEVAPDPPPEPIPAPAPSTRPRPAAVAKPAPDPVVQPEPEPEPEPAKPEPTEVEAPPGYEGVPKELWPD